MNISVLRRLSQLLTDLFALASSWKLSLIVFSSVMPALRLTPGPNGSRFTPSFFEVLALWILLAFWMGVIRAADDSYSWGRLVTAFHASIAVACAVILASFISADVIVGRSRVLTLVLTPISFILFYTSRFAVAGFASRLDKRAHPVRGVAVMGCDEEAISMLEHLRLSETDPVRGIILPEGRSMECAHAGTLVLGTTKELGQVINRERLHRIVLLNGSLSDGELETCSGIANRMGVTMSCAVGVSAPTRKLVYSFYSGIPLIEIQPVSFTAFERLIKRSLDMLGSSILLLILAPLFAIIAYLVKASSDGPILFVASRVGRGGRHFSFLKFRTMYTDASRLNLASSNEKDGHLFKIRNDPRVTRIGRFLRRYSLDELPQLINVLLGDMSLVGPRPLPIEDMEPDGMSQKFAIWSEQRASVPPGITGLWQVRGRSELPFSDLVKYDLEYVHNWSLGMDFKILFSTPHFVFSGKGAF
jgi:exopolysaccharide biosynthesis polyprenyl glycosylphosphotransferase